MADFSIESRAEQIYHPRTKEYFHEVLSSYVNGHFRSAVVMLYSVVICDLIYKLKELVERDNDTRAERILGEVSKKKIENPTSSDWETYLVDEICKSLNILETQDQIHIESLRKHRHLSAHPVLDEDDMLYNPSKEVVRSHMRTMLERILLKAPRYSNTFAEELIKIIPNLYYEILDDDHFENYLYHKYFNHFSDSVKIKLFKILWKFVFRLNNEECKEHRIENYAVLQILHKRYRYLILNAIKEDPDYYSNIECSDKDQFKYLVDFLIEEPKVYSLFKNPAQILIQEKLEKRWVLFVRAWYVSGSLNKHIDTVAMKAKTMDKTLPIRSTEVLYRLAKDEAVELIDKVIDLVIDNFSRSESYDDTKKRLHLVKLILNDCKGKHIDRLLKVCDSNRQIYERWDIESIIEDFVERAEDIGYEINTEMYKHISLSA